jgi:hypothetical protein
MFDEHVGPAIPGAIEPVTLGIVMFNASQPKESFIGIFRMPLGLESDLSLGESQNIGLAGRP